MKAYNEKEFCFILCANNDRYLKECLLYLSLLEVPPGYTMQVLSIESAVSMASGYNEAMNASKARYKIYLHQDTLITEKNFLQKLLDVFAQDEQIGMVGMIGTPALSKDGVMWHGDRCGDFYRLDEMLANEVQGIEKVVGKARDVEAVDGLLMATRADIPWREDLLKGWDFYDVSQCMEFRRAGYRVVVPEQNPSWTIHACGIPSFWHYNRSREIVLENYPEIGRNCDKLRILFLHSNMILLLGLPMGLTGLGHKVDIPDKKVSLNAYSEEERASVEEFLEEGHYDLAVTYDFCQSVAAACREMGVKYLSWVYDDPLLELYTPQAGYDCNRICVFDKAQYGRLSRQGLKNLFYFPLAAEVDCFGSVGISKKDEKRYAADISFVGRLYAKRGYERLTEGAEDSLLREAEDIVNGTDCRWEENAGVFGRASDRLTGYLAGREERAVFEQYSIDKGYYFESMYLARKANELERIRILNRLGERFRTYFYTDKQECGQGVLKNVVIRPWVDYWNEMPKVFHISKINLNITSRSIESGIPQRVFDAMAVGGFVLTNFQPELEDYFREGVDLEVYRCMDELLEKAAFYLRHEEARVRIAMNGYRKVKRCHSYQVRMQEVLARIGSCNIERRDIR